MRPRGRRSGASSEVCAQAVAGATSTTNGEPGIGSASSSGTSDSTAPPTPSLRVCSSYESNRGGVALRALSCGAAGVVGTLRRRPSVASAGVGFATRSTSPAASPATARLRPAPLSRHREARPPLRGGIAGFERRGIPHTGSSVYETSLVRTTITTMNDE
eukprot:scaffold130311_cov32-Tisochrysis_lutea.AAC.4